MKLHRLHEFSPQLIFLGEIRLYKISYNLLIQSEMLNRSHKNVIPCKRDIYIMKYKRFSC